MKNRRDFLKTACKPIVLATLGIPIIEACSNEEEQPEINSSSVNNNQTTQNNSSSELEINLDDNRFSSLKQVGGWLNFTSENILLVRISDNEIYNLTGTNPDKEKIIEILGWGSNSEELNDRLINTNYYGKIYYIVATPSEVKSLVDYYNQQKQQQPVAQIGANVGGGMNQKPKITQAEAKRKAKDCRKTSQYQGQIGDIISISGYVVFISNPFRNKINGYGRSLGVLSDAGDYYLIWFYNKDVPTLGQYICLEDYEVKGHNYYRNYRLNQTVIDKAGQTWRDCTL